MNLDEFFTSMILPIGRSGTNQIQYMKYTSEYILKLQIHQQMALHNSACIGYFRKKLF